MRPLLILVLLLRAGAAMAATGTPIPFKQEAPAAGPELLRIMGGLVLCIVLLGAVLLILRRRAGRAGRGGDDSPAGGRLRVVETRRLDARSALHIVEFGGANHLLAQGEHGITLLVSAPGTALYGNGRQRGI